VIKIEKGDCLELMKTIPDKSVDLILCDPPFGTTQNKWDSVIPFDLLWSNYRRILKDGGAIVLFASQPFTSTLICSNLEGFKYQWVWEKSSATGHLNAKVMPMKLHEDICVFGVSKGKIRYNPQGLIPFNKMVRRGNNGTNFGKSGTENFQEFTNYPRSILRFASDPKPVHPTQKPVALLEYLIRTYSNEGETVLDNTMGSGSCAIACLNSNRNFLGMEKDEKYFEIAKKRIKESKKK
jgi:site-specific DNA-methyltransferase (adenine-specific)